MLFGLRIFKHKSLDYAVRTTCPCEDQEILVDSDPDMLHSLGSLEINYSKVDPTAPIAFRVDFPESFIGTDGETITHTYISPLRFFQVTKFEEATKQKVGGDVKQAELSIIGCQESNAFATPGQGGMIEEFWEYLPTRSRIYLTNAIASIGNGKPFGMSSATSIEFDCPVCPQERKCTANATLFMPRDLILDSAYARAEEN